MKNGKFIISLDFELMWGVRDKRTKESYGENILGVQNVIPHLLDLFSACEVKATFSTVGFLFAKNKIELLNSLPTMKPEYINPNLSPYNGYIEALTDAETDPYHFAHNLIQNIQENPEHEIGTHTFSHYYCLESGQNLESFRSDLKAALSIAKKMNLTLTSIVFPRNQVNKAYLKTCSDLGITCYRGTEESWLYKERNEENESLIRRALRLIDAYINISGHHSYSDDYFQGDTPINIPSSRFLRPFSPRLRFLDGFRLRRITSGMTYAAKHNLVYHLWWHPHNFGINQTENLDFLKKILEHYKTLNNLYKFESLTMSNLAKSLLKQ